MCSSFPFDVQVLMDCSYEDAHNRGTIRDPMEIEVDAINCEVDIAVDMDSDYADAKRRFTLLAPMDIEVEALNLPKDVVVAMDRSYADAKSRGDLLVPMVIIVDICCSTGDVLVDDQPRRCSDMLSSNDQRCGESLSPQDESLTPLSKEDEETIKLNFSRNKSDILVSHLQSNIVITGDILSCLKPREWLNDDVINLYIALLKEREIREPTNHLKCHFFNTFFFGKLLQSGTGYNYNAVRKWTSMKKIGYHLKDCDKIFVPIGKDLHWTLAVINIKDKKFQFLDSFKGYSSSSIFDALAKYYADEVKDKNQLDLDLSHWAHEFVEDLPVQSNLFDCGMFVLKYMDFYSKGLGLCFTQEQMPYFRLRTTKEILQLKAE